MMYVLMTCERDDLARNLTNHHSREFLPIVTGLSKVIMITWQKLHCQCSTRLSAERTFAATGFTSRHELCTFTVRSCHSARLDRQALCGRGVRRFVQEASPLVRGAICLHRVHCAIPNSSIAHRKSWTMTMSKDASACYHALFTSVCLESVT